MREIKFRAWDVNGVEMVSWERLLRIRYGKEGGNLFNDPDHKLMQYTGLKDKNDKKIYEGDVCDFKRSDELCGEVDLPVGMSGEIKWDDSTDACFYIETNIDRIPYVKLYYAENLEVIGNIYENKELLNE